MRAYKFRGSSQFDLTLDVLFNQRLYCADWSKLNDPMEGRFVYSHSSSDEADYKNVVQEIIEHKQRLRVCSLSKTFDCHLLWAHYASGFDGLAIELELPEDDPRIRNVQYRGVFGYVGIDRVRDPGQVASEILSSKYQEWKYEQEVRVLIPDEYYPVPGGVKRVIAGHRMKPALFQALRIICEARGITLCRTGIGDEGIDADFVYAPPAVAA
jgi:hypothetical protein